MTTTTNDSIRFMDNNLGELTTGNVTYSSALAPFVGANSLNKFRSKVWKPSGNFLITLDVNDQLFIDDGTPKIVIITAGNYATPDLLATEIQTQLNASSSGWTFDYNNTAGDYSFRFAHASAHTLQFSLTTESIWDTIGFTTTSDDIISTDRVADEPRNHSEESVIWDLGYNQAVEFFAVISPLGEEFSISANATIRLQGNNINDFATTPFDETLTRSDQGVFRFLDDVADTSYRFWKFSFIDKENVSTGPTGFSLAYIYLGDYTTLTGTNIQVGFSKTIEDESLVTESESGVTYYDRKTKFAKIESANIALLGKNERDALEQLFFDFGISTPLFISLDPKLCISNALEDLTKYMVFDDRPKFSHVRSQYFNMTLKFREVL